MYLFDLSTRLGYEGRYRTPEAVSRELREIRDKIDTLNSMLNARDIITEILTSLSQGEYQRLAKPVTDMVDSATMTLNSLRALYEDLSLMSRELEDLRCLI